MWSPLGRDKACPYTGLSVHRPHILVGEQRRSGDRRDLRTKRRHVALPVGMDAVREKDDVAPCVRVEPQRCAGKTGVAEGTEWKQLAAVRRVRRIDVPPEAAQNRLVGRFKKR